MSIIITPGKKIKQLRKRLGFKQSDLAGGQITRNLISIIENDKAALTHNVSEILCNNINSLCIERDIDFSISKEELLESVEEQSSRIADDFLKKLDAFDSTKTPTFEKFMDDVEEFLTECKSNSKKTILLQKISEMYRTNHDYQNTYQFLLRAFENSEREFSDKKQLTLLLNLGACSSVLGRYTESLKYNRIALSNSDIMPIDYKYKFYYNMADDYFRLERHEKSINLINKIHDLFSLTYKQLFKLEVLKANNYMATSEYDKAVDILEKLAEDNKIGDTQLILVYSNLLFIYHSLRDKVSIKKYLDLSLILISKLEAFDTIKAVSGLCLNIAKGYEVLLDYDHALEYYRLALDIALKFNFDVKIHNALACIFDIVIDDTYELNEFKNLIVELIKQKKIDSSNITFLKMIRHYSVQQDHETIKELIELSIELMQ